MAKDFHLYFCKRVLTVKKNTPRCISELQVGRYKIPRLIEGRSIAYLGRLVNSKDNKLAGMMNTFLRMMYDKENRHALYLKYPQPPESKSQKLLFKFIDAKWLTSTGDLNDYPSGWSTEVNINSQCI